MLLWRAALGRAVWRAAFVHVRFGLSAYYDRGRVRCCQGGIFANTTADSGRRDSRLRGNDGRGAGYDGMGVRARRRMQDGGIPAYAGMTCERVSSCRVGRTFLRS